jgi:drug/metabolite transporter (DMT)-like permease
MTSSSSAQDAYASRHLAGIGLMALGIFIFALNDALGKWLIATYSVGQLLLIRSAAALVLLVPLIWREPRVSFTAAPRPFIQVLRAVLATLEVACFYWALAYMPLADVMTFYLAGPIYVTAMSPFLLGEQVGWRRWAAVLAGFIGVMIALNPSGQSLSLAAFVAIAGSFSFSLLMICTRLVPGTSDVVLVTSQTVAALIFGIVAAPFAWTPLRFEDSLLLALLGVTALVAHMCINRSLKIAPATVVVPYQYTTIVWAILLGFFIFGDIPTVSMLAGATTIIAAGLYIFLRERIRARPHTVAEPP